MYIPSHFSPTSVSVDLGALAHNLAYVRRLAPGSEVLAVVKANAYGHGAIEVTRALQRLAVSRFAVATVDEGLALRQAGVHDDIVVMGATVPAQFSDLVAHRLTPVLFRADMVQAFADKVPRAVRPYRVHIKVDTGMGRLGLAGVELPDLIGSSVFRTALHLEGVMTHLADADNENRQHTETQLERFQQSLEVLRQHGFAVPLVHAANSAAIAKHPASHYSLVRPGLLLYGYHTAAPRALSGEVRPILTWKATVAHLHHIQRGESVSYNRTFIAPRPSRIAVLPVGYADGYNRLLSNRGAVLIGGRRVPIVGRVCMDMTMADVTDVPEVTIGDDAVLIGQQGKECITAADLAAWQETIPYEILCAIGPRVPRQHLPLP